MTRRLSKERHRTKVEQKRQNKFRKTGKTAPKKRFEKKIAKSKTHVIMMMKSKQEVFDYGIQNQ
jgi:hypothetical protein